MKKLEFSDFEEAVVEVANSFEVKGGKNATTDEIECTDYYDSSGTLNSDDHGVCDEDSAG